MFGFGAQPTVPGFGVPGVSGPGAPAEDIGDFPILIDGKRRPAFAGRISGSVQEWKGKFGWLIPDEPINHPEARMKGGKIYFAQEDVLEVISGVGAHVSFYVYCDGNGLGALNVVPADSKTARTKITKSKPKAKAQAKSTPGRKRVSEELIDGLVKSWRGTFGFITPSSPIDHPLFTGSLFLHSQDAEDPSRFKEGTPVTFYLYSDAQGLGAEQCSIIDEDSAGGGAAPAPAAPASGILQARPKGGGPTMLVATPKGGPTPKGGSAAGVMKATPKASAAVKASGDPDLARKMAENPEIAKQLSAWMFDPGG